jgi:hypothetical protein
MRPPSSLRITTVAGRGRRGLLTLPNGQLLNADGFAVLGEPNWLFQKLVDSPGDHYSRRGLTNRADRIAG